jgi:DNA-binding transcriptional ArsR family regulator
MRDLKTTALAGVVAFGAALAEVAPAMAHGHRDRGVVSGFQSHGAPANAPMHHGDRNDFAAILAVSGISIAIASRTVGASRCVAATSSAVIGASIATDGMEATNPAAVRQPRALRPRPSVCSSTTRDAGLKCNMDAGLKIAQIASLVGDPARANMLVALINGGTLTASKLAYVSGVSAQTASGHLAKLDDAGLLRVQKQGRRPYFCLASPRVAHMLEGIMFVAQDGPARQREWRGGDRGGHRFFWRAPGIDLSFGSKRRVFCRPCLDWSERRPHLAGIVGAAILNHALVHDWVRRARDRELSITPAGRRGLFETFGIESGD